MEKLKCQSNSDCADDSYCKKPDGNCADQVPSAPKSTLQFPPFPISHCCSHLISLGFVCQASSVLYQGVCSRLRLRWTYLIRFFLLMRFACVPRVFREVLSFYRDIWQCVHGCFFRRLCGLHWLVHTRPGTQARQQHLHL